MNKNKCIYACIPRKAVAIRVFNELKDEFAKKGKSIKIYHGDLNKSDKKTVDINNEWIEYDLVITTLTITVGIDFTVDHFHLGVVWGDRNCGLPRDLVQCMLRARKLKKWILSVNASAYTGWCPSIKRYYQSFEDKKCAIQSFLDRQQKNDKNQTNIDSVSEFVHMPEWLRHIYFTNIYEQDLSKLYYKLMLQFFLNKLGCVVNNLDYAYHKIATEFPEWEQIDTIDKNQFNRYTELSKRG